MFVVRSFSFIIFCLFFSDAYGQANYELDTYYQQDAYEQVQSGYFTSGRSFSESEQDQYGEDYGENSLSESISGRSLLSEQEQNEPDYAYDQDYANEPFEDQVISGRSLLFGDHQISGRSLLSSDQGGNVPYEYEQNQSPSDSPHDMDVDDGMEIPIAERTLSSSLAGTDCGKTPNTPSVGYLNHFSVFLSLSYIFQGKAGETRCFKIFESSQDYQNEIGKTIALKCEKDQNGATWVSAGSCKLGSSVEPWLMFNDVTHESSARPIICPSHRPYCKGRYNIVGSNRSSRRDNVRLSVIVISCFKQSIFIYLRWMASG